MNLHSKGIHSQPAFGDYHAVYGLLIDKIELPERHATDLVTALKKRLGIDVRDID